MPHDLDLESVILGAVLLERGALDRVIDFFIPELFYAPANAQICECILGLYAQNKPIDQITVAQQLMALGTINQVGGIPYIASLTARIASSANLETYLLYLTEMFRRREIIKAAIELVDNQFDLSVDLFESEINFDVKLSAIRSKTELSQAQDFLQVAIDSIKQLQEAAAGKIEVGVSIPYPTLSKVMKDCLSFGELTILGARPSVGKSAMALEFVKHNGGLFVGYEMSNKEQFLRWVSSETEMNSYNLTHPQNFAEAHWGAINEVVSSAENRAQKTYFLQGYGMKVEQIAGEIARQKRKHNIKFVVIDYVQIMPHSLKFADQNNQVGHISKQLKQIAGRLNVHILLLSQLSRESSKSATLPALHDLRDSGSLEQDANNVVFIHEPTDQQWDDFVNGIELPFFNEGQKTLYKKVLVGVAKQRGGHKNKWIPMFYEGESYKFWEIPQLLNYLKYGKRDDTALLNESNLTPQNQFSPYEIMPDTTPLDF